MISLKYLNPSKNIEKIVSKANKNEENNKGLGFSACSYVH